MLLRTQGMIVTFGSYMLKVGLITGSNTYPAGYLNSPDVEMS